MTKGFTLIEALTGVAIILVLSLLSIPAVRTFQEHSDLATEGMVTALRTTQNKAKASEGNSSWGVYMNNTVNPNQYTIFQGVSYATRDVAQDKTIVLPSRVEFSDISLGGGNETVFQKVTGFPVPSGSVSFWLTSDHSQTQTVSWNFSGTITTGTFSVASDESRVKDSRHVHADYTGRIIDTTTEFVQLVFPGITKTIPIVDNLQGGEFSWEGQVLSQGEMQTIRIHTHALNDPILGTQFSVHRDKRYNTKSLDVELSGDSTGNILQYDGAGQTTNGTSVYASTLVWQ